MTIQRWTLVVVCAATAMLMLDIAVVNTAISDMGRDLHTGLGGLKWVVDAYTLALAAVVLTTGSLADRLGRRRVFAAGLAVFTVASGVAAAKWGGTCTGPVTVRFHTLRSDTLGMARWAGMWDVPPDERDDCQIWLNSRKKWDWDKLCTTVVHEYGHLSGHDHSSDENSPMHATYTRAYRGCRTASAARRWED